MNNDLSEIKHSHNIIDIIGQYVQLKKSGKTHTACCPFHNEKTASFTVDEGKQFYHCFGCGANGDVIKFIQEFSGVDFVQACKDLGAQVQLMPSKKVQANITASKTRNPLLPGYDKRAPEKSAEFLSGSVLVGNHYENRSLHYFAVSDMEGEIVNVAGVTGEPIFIAGGVSHLAGVWLHQNDTDNWFVVADFWQGYKISTQRKINVLISFSAYNTLLICKYNHHTKRMPVLRYEDTQAEQLCDEMKWVYLDLNGKLTKKNIGEYLD